MRAIFIRHSDILFSYSQGKRPLFFRPSFPERGSSSAIRDFEIALTKQSRKASSPMSNTNTNKEVHYELRCRECGRTWGNQPRNICDECFSPLEISYDYDAARALVAQGTFTRERIAQRPPDMWRYSELLPLPRGFNPTLPV